MAPQKHRHRERNAPDGIPDDILLSPAPMIASVAAPPTALVPYAAPNFPLLAPQAPRAQSRTGRAVRAVRKKAAETAGKVADAVKPELATVTGKHLAGVGSAAAGAGAAALAAWQLIDNVGALPLAIATTVAGGVGTVAFKGNWQKAAIGMLGAGILEFGVLGLTEAALKKAAKAKAEALKAATPTTPAPAAGNRNAYSPGGDDDLVQAMERAERRLGHLFDADEARNATAIVDELDEFGWGV